MQSTESEGQGLAGRTDRSRWMLPAATRCVLETELRDPSVLPGLCLVRRFISFSKPLGLQRSLATEAKDQFRKVLSKAFLSSY